MLKSVVFLIFEFGWLLVKSDKKELDESVNVEKLVEINVLPPPAKVV